MLQMDTAVTDGGAKAAIAIAPDDTAMRRKIAVARPATTTEAVGEPEQDRDLLTMIDTIVPTVESAAMGRTDSESAAHAVIRRSLGNLHQPRRRRASPQHLSPLRMSATDVLSLSSSLPQDCVLRSLSYFSRRLARSKRHKSSRTGLAVDLKGT